MLHILSNDFVAAARRLSLQTGPWTQHIRLLAEGGTAAATPRWDWSFRSHFPSNQTAVSGR